MAIVVSDTSPIRALAFLDLIGLIRDLYVAVLVPPAVDRELKEPASGLIVVDVGTYPFIQIQVPTDRARVEAFSGQLDPGESEALALALELQATLILIDELEGRAVASKNGLVPVGVLGTLVRAKERGLIKAIGPLLDKLQGELRFFISPILKAEILRL